MTATIAENWHSLRKTAHAILTPQGVNKHLAIQKAEAIQLLYDFSTKPKVNRTINRKRGRLSPV